MTTPGIIEQLDRCLAFENELIATVGEEFYMWIAKRAAHPAPNAGNEGGASKWVRGPEGEWLLEPDDRPPPTPDRADYEAKARDAIKRKFLEATPVPLTGTVSIAYGPPMVIDEEATVAAIVVALAQAAADERERCEAIARAEAKRAVGFPRGFYAAENIANAIAALAEPKVGWTKAARSVWYKDASNPNAPEIVDDNLKLNE